MARSADSAPISDDFEMIDHQDTSLDLEELDKIQKWLRPTDFLADSSEFRRHLSSQAPETGLWICNTSRYQQWHQSDDHGSLWVKGVPGAGKSVIAASMVEHLRTTEDVPVLFFFFRYIVAANRKPRNLIQDFLTQLLPRCPKLQSILRTLVDSELDHQSDERLWEFLLLGLSSIEKAYCVVDAMDEMELNASDTFLQRLNDLAIFQPSSVKLFMTSRPKQYLQSALRDASIVHISLEDDLVGKDIALFVAHRLKDVLSDDENRQFQASLELTICERSRGLFLYARLLVDQIIPKLQTTGQLDIQKLAKSVPVGLEDMYNFMLYQNTQNQKLEVAVQVFLLEFVTHSSRTLRLNELANVLAFEFPPEMLAGTPKNVARTACTPLLEILEDETVQVIHHSFTEFLLNTERTKNTNDGKTPQFPTFDSSQVHKKLALTSLRYLQSGVLQHPDAEEFEKQRCKCDGDIDCRCRRDGKRMDHPYNYQELRLRYLFLEYTVTNWAFHCHQCDTDDQELLQAVSSFLQPESLDFKQWLRLEWSTRHVPETVEAPAPLHVAAFAGMTKYAALILRDGQKVDPLDASEFTPLHWACRRGHVAMVTLLLHHGADPNAHNCRGVVPLHEAAQRDHSNIVKLLLEVGVDPMSPKTKENSAGRIPGGRKLTKGETAVEYACQQGHLNTILAMLPYLKTESLKELLGRACRHGEFEIAKAVLTKTDVSPNSKFEGGNALYVATTTCNTSIVEILLSKGADPCKKCDYGPNYRIMGCGRHGEYPVKAPIHGLVYAWNESTHIACHQILNMLLQAGADIDAKDGNEDTALLTIFADGHVLPYVAVRSLLEAGANVSAANQQGDSVLLRALGKCRNIDVIKLLIDHGAKVDVQGHHGETALHKVLAHRRRRASDSVNAILTMLLEKGAKPDIMNDFGETALQKAILNSTCSFETFKLLLEKCDASAAKSCMWLLGSRKSVEETKEFIKLLLSRGASLEDRSNAGKTPVTYDPRSLNATDALKQLGANIYAVDNSGRGLLHEWARLMGGLTLLKTFQQYVASGLDPFAVDFEGNTVLHIAAGHFEGTARRAEFIAYLLDVGISMNTRNNKGETPLMINIANGQINSSSDEKRVSLLELFQRHEKKEIVDLNAQDNDGLGAIHLATLQSEFRLAPLLFAGADHTLVTKDNHKCRELINSQDKDGRTPLHDACTSGRPESVFCLLRAGASVNLTDGHGRTSLHACATFPIEEKLWSLLDRVDRYNPPPLGSTIQKDRFRPNPGRGYEHTPWYGSNRMSRQTSEHDTCRVGPIVDMLLEAGADSLALDGKKRFPLDLAIENDCRDMISRLVFTQEKMMESWNVEEDSRKKLSTLLAIKTAPKTPTFEQLDEETRKEILKKPNTWLGLLDYLSLCTWVKKNKEELGNDAETTNKLLKEAASNGLTELMTALGSLAALNDKPSTVKTRLEQRPSANYYLLPDFAPSLHVACSRTSNNLPLIKFLVEKCSIDINAYDLVLPTQQPLLRSFVQGSTALHVLAKTKYYWQISAIQYLISHGADVSMLNEKGETPLHVASTGDKKTNMGTSEAFWTTSSVSILLEHGANPNILSQEGFSCLHKASSSPSIMKLLLANGADLNLGSISPLFPAMQSQDLKAMEILLDAGADPNSIDEKRLFQIDYLGKEQTRHALFCACFPTQFYRGWINSVPLVTLLIRRGANPYASLSETETLIHYVFEHAEEEIILACLDESVAPLIDYSRRDQAGKTVLLAAANWTQCLTGYRQKHGFPKVQAPVIRLLDLNIDPLARDNEGKNVLHHLCANEDVEEDAIMQFLSHPKFSTTLLFQKDRDGYKPFHFALKVLRPRVVERILELGNQQDLLDTDPKGWTTLHYIAAQCLEKIERQRSSHMNRDHDPGFHTGLFSLWQKFLELGGKIDGKNNEGNTALFIFLASSSLDKAEEQVCHVDGFEKFFSGADIATRNKNGETALHIIAKRSGKEDDDKKLDDHDKRLFEVLVKRGLDPLTEDGMGRSALDVCAVMGKVGILEMFERSR